MLNKALIAAVAAPLVGGGTWAGGVAAVDWLDDRYAPLAAVEDLAWSQMKEDIRNLRMRISQAENPGLIRELQLDLQDLLDRFCRSYPDDRECRNAD